jgi:hypothetical protein
MESSSAGSSKKSHKLQKTSEKMSRKDKPPATSPENEAYLRGYADAMADIHMASVFAVHAEHGPPPSRDLTMGLTPAEAATQNPSRGEQLGPSSIPQPVTVYTPPPPRRFISQRGPSSISRDAPVHTIPGEYGPTPSRDMTMGLTPDEAAAQRRYHQLFFGPSAVLQSMTDNRAKERARERAVRAGQAALTNAGSAQHGQQRQAREHRQAKECRQTRGLGRPRQRFSDNCDCPTRSSSSMLEGRSEQW